MAGLIDDGWSLVIYPEGGRSPDGWGQTFRGGAAYLAGRTGAPVVPVYIDGTDSIMGKGTSVPKPGRTRVTFGSPLRRRPEESTRRFNERIARRRRHPRRRVDHRLLVGSAARRGRSDPVADRTGVHRLAPPLGRSPIVAGGASPAGARRPGDAGPTSADRVHRSGRDRLGRVREPTASGASGASRAGSARRRRRAGDRRTRVHRGLEVGDDVGHHRRQHRLGLLPGDVTGPTGDEHADDQRCRGASGGSRSSGCTRRRSPRRLPGRSA